MSKQTDDRYKNVDYSNYNYRQGPRAQQPAKAAPQPTQPPAYAPKKKRRRAKKILRRAVIMVVTVGLMLGISWGITQLIQNRLGGDVEDVPPVQPATEPVVIPPSSNVILPEPTDPLDVLPAIDNSSWNFVGPVQSDAEPMQLLNTDSRMIALPENGRVDMQYFDTTVFVGDSITQGLEGFTQGIPNAKYCAYLGASPRAFYSGESLKKKRDSPTAEVPLDALVGYQPDNVYILLGTNAMVAMDDESLLAYYGEMIDAFKAALHPEVSFYIQSITPVVQGVDNRFSAERIAGLNNALAKMAFEKGCYFIDLHEALAGEDGWLRPDYGARDGYHLQPIGYKAWVEYLVTHTAYNRRHAHYYLEGSHYFEQAPRPA